MAGNFMIIFNHFKHLQNIPPHIHVWPGYWKRTEITENWTERLRCHIFHGGFFHSVIVLQLSDLSLVTVDFTLQAFNLLFVVVDFFLMMLLQCSQLLLLLASMVQINRLRSFFFF